MINKSPLLSRDSKPLKMRGFTNHGSTLVVVAIRVVLIVLVPILVVGGALRKDRCVTQGSAVSPPEASYQLISPRQL